MKTLSKHVKKMRGGKNEVGGMARAVVAADLVINV